MTPPIGFSVVAIYPNGSTHVFCLEMPNTVIALPFLHSLQWENGEKIVVRDKDRRIIAESSDIDGFSFASFGQGGVVAFFVFTDHEKALRRSKLLDNAKRGVQFAWWPDAQKALRDLAAFLPDASADLVAFAEAYAQEFDSEKSIRPHQAVEAWAETVGKLSGILRDTPPELAEHPLAGRDLVDFTPITARAPDVFMAIFPPEFAEEAALVMDMMRRHIHRRH